MALLLPDYRRPNGEDGRASLGENMPVLQWMIARQLLEVVGTHTDEVVQMADI